MRIIKNSLAIAIGILPINIYMIWYRLTHTVNFSIFEMLAYPLIFGGVNILLILGLNRYLLKENFSSFNPGKKKWLFDIFSGIILTVIFFLLVIIEQPILNNILPRREPPSNEIIRLMIELARNPLYLILWLGPVVWIGVALFEELARVFFMKCLWNMINDKIWHIASIILVALITGVLHLYQGWFGIISVSIQGLIMGFFYFKYKRIWPLVISHALYDSIQIIIFVTQI